MKKTFLYICAAALFFIAPSCEGTDEPDGGEDITPGEYFWHFGVENADPAQPIGLFVRDFDGSMTNEEIHLDATSGASFEIKTDYPLTTGGKVYAYSPYVSSNSKHDALKLSIPADQAAGEVVMPKVAVPLVLDEPSQENTGTLRFVDLAGTLDVKVYSTEATGEQIQKIVFESDSPLAGSFTFNGKTADPNQSVTMALSGLSEKTVSVTGSADIVTDAEAAKGLPMILAPGTYSGTVTVTTNVDTYGIVLDEPVVVSRGSASSLAIRIAPRTTQDDEGNTEEFEGGELDTGSHAEKPEGSISILAIGNSFSIDGMQYLYNILVKLGYTDIHLGNLYIAGCTLETHAANVTGNLKAYRYYTNSTGDWTSVTDYSSITALKERAWDYITVQQASKFSGMPATYQPYLNTVLDEIKLDCPKAHRGWHMTWAYQGSYSSANFGNYGNNQMTMYNAIISTVQSEIVAKNEFDFVIPTGTAIQNLRTSFIGDNLNRDGTHLSYDLGRLTAAMMWARQITGKSIQGVKFTPAGYTITDEQFAAIWEAVDAAYDKPFEITKSSTSPDPVTPDPTPGPETGTLPTEELNAIFTGAGYSLSEYEPVPIQYTHFAYWNTQNNGSTLQTKSNQTSSNLNIFSATQMFAKDELPVGTVIVLKAGHRYRPDCMTSLSEKTVSGNRRGNVDASGTNSIIKIDDAWWNDKGVAWNFCGFNVCKYPSAALDEAGHKELETVFAIYKPKQ